MWEWNYKESWVPNNWCFWIVVGEDSWESFGLQGDQSCVFIGRTDVEAETPKLGPPDVKSWLIWKDPDAGKDWGQEEKGTTEDKMVGWHHRLNGHRFRWTPGVGDGQGDLACCGLWVRKESETTERLDWTRLNSPIPVHFSLLILKMSMFILAISCLTTSNLSWFMELSIQVPMQCCSLQHQTLFPSPDAFTTGCCFCLGSIS